MQTHDFTATMQFGTVSAVDAAAHSLRVKIPVLDDMETDWLPMATPAAGGNRFYSLPDVGELVVCLLDARGEAGCVIGAIYNATDSRRYPTKTNGSNGLLTARSSRTTGAAAKSLWKRRARLKSKRHRKWTSNRRKQKLRAMRR